jgi:hypothetical protein
LQTFLHAAFRKPVFPYNKGFYQFNFGSEEGYETPYVAGVRSGFIRSAVTCSNWVHEAL